MSNVLIVLFHLNDVESSDSASKNLMHLIFGTGQLKYPALFGLKESDINQAYEAAETQREKAKFGVLD